MRAMRTRAQGEEITLAHYNILLFYYKKTRYPPPHPNKEEQKDIRGVDFHINQRVTRVSVYK